MIYKELNDEQFIELIKSSGYFDSCTKFIKILVRNTLDHYQEKPLFTTRILSKEDSLPGFIEYNEELKETSQRKVNIENLVKRAEKEIRDLLENEIVLYNKIKEYKLFFGMDITKNIMVTIVYDRNIYFEDNKHVITYII